MARTVATRSFPPAAESLEDRQPLATHLGRPTRTRGRARLSLHSGYDLNDEAVPPEVLRGRPGVGVQDAHHVSLAW
jgi:hypothetical protein